MAVDYYVNFYDSKGKPIAGSESQISDKNLANADEVQDVSFSVQSSINGSGQNKAGASKTILNPLTFTMSVDKLSSTIQQYVFNGTPFEVLIRARKSVGGALNDSQGSIFLSDDFKGATVGSYQFTGGDESPKLTFSINYNQISTKYYAQKSDGTLQTTPVQGGWNTITNMPAVKAAIIQPMLLEDASSENSPSASSISTPSVPYIIGTGSYASTNSGSLSPFDTAFVVDENGDGTNPNVLTISISGDGGTLSDGADFTGSSSLTRKDANTYVISGSSTDVTAELQSLIFTPSNGQSDGTNNTTISLTVTDSTTGLSSTTDSNTTILVPASVASVPAPDQPSADATQAATQPIASSVQPQLSGGQTTLPEQAQGSQADKSVSAPSIDTVTNKDVVVAQSTPVTNTMISGPSPAAVIAHPAPPAPATPTGVSDVTSTDNGDGTYTYSFSGGKFFNKKQYSSFSDVIAPDGSVLREEKTKNDGSNVIDIFQSYQTVTSDSQDIFNAGGVPNVTFVFQPQHGSDIVRQFRTGGADHDTLSFSGSDFGNSIANVLRGAHDTKQGVVIVDPTTKDKVQLNGISKSQLAHHQDVISFHA